MVTIIFLMVVLGIARRATSVEERAHFYRAVANRVREAKTRVDRVIPDCEEFRDALRARTPRALVTPALVALNTAVFLLILLNAAAPGDLETLVGWGASFAPRTTNGEWWRLITTTFVHSGMLHLIVNIIGLVQAGLILERLVGRAALAVVYVSAAVFSSLSSLAMHPVVVTVGASGAVFGIQGLLLATVIVGSLYRSPLTIPVTALLRLAPATAVFIVYNQATTGFDTAAAAGLLTGVVCGLGFLVNARDAKPGTIRIAAAAVAAMAIAITWSAFLSDVTDVRPELARVVAVEGATTNVYQAALERFRKRQITAEALAQLIDRSIMPELRAVRERLKVLSGVPAEHQPLVAGADEYLRLRDESWQLRADGLRKTNMLTLREAERRERASLEALEKIRRADQIICVSHSFRPCTV